MLCKGTAFKFFLDFDDRNIDEDEPTTSSGFAKKKLVFIIYISRQDDAKIWCHCEIILKICIISLF